MFLVIGVTIIYFGCSENNTTAPELSQGDQVTTTLAKAKLTFEGISECLYREEGVPTILPNGKILVVGKAQYLDVVDNPRVSGLALWTTNKKKEADLYSVKLWGKIELFVGVAKVEDVDNAMGKWDISFHGYKTGPFVVIEATGQGKEGSVKGLVAKWEYKMDIRQGFTFTTKGLIFEK